MKPTSSAFFRNPLPKNKLLATLCEIQFQKQFLMAFLALIFAHVAKTQPACTATYTNGNATIIVNSGETACIPEGSTYFGTMVVRSGANVVVCDADFTGSLTIDPGGTLYDSPGTGYSGSLSVNGTRNTGASYCCSALNPGTIGSNQTICSGATPAGLTSSAAATGGNSSFSYLWQISTTSAVAGFSDIGSATSTTYSPGALTQDTWYRRKVSSCSGASVEYTAAIKITITPLPTITGSTGASRCATGTLGINATASAGSIEWFAAASGGGSIGSSSSGVNWTTPSISATTIYYAEALNSTCRSTARTAVTATVVPTLNAGSIASAQSICYNTTPAAFTSAAAASGGTGAYNYQWQISTTSAVAGFSDIGSATAATYSPPGNITQDTWYRRAVTSGVCGPEYTTAVKVTVYADLANGTIGTAQSIYYNSTPSGLTNIASPTGGTGAYTYQWQISTTSGIAGFSDIMSATSSTYNPPSALTQDTWYRRAETSGACGTVYSASIKITIELAVCSGATPPSFTNDVAATGATDYQWEISTDGISWSNIPGATSATYIPTAISQTTYYKRGAINGSCGPIYSNTLTVNVTSTPGGVTSNMVVWLKADEGTGSLSSTWTDQSGNGHNYTTVSGPTLITSDPTFNYNPVVEIADGGFDAPSGSELGSDWTIFFVSKLLQADSDGRLFDGHSGNYFWGYHGGYRNGLYMNGSPASHNTGIASTSGVTDPHLFCYTRESTGGTIEARVDGQLLATYSSTNDANGQRIDINQGLYASQGSDSRIGEFIIFNSKLSSSEIDQVESYLANKFGITRSASGGGTNGDYVSFAGTNIWDASAHSDYNNDVITLGRECSFHQKQSRSDDDSLRVFISSLASSNASNGGTVTNTESYLIIGHNGGRQRATAASNSEKPAGINNRIEREYKIKNTNFDNTYSLEMEWDSTGNVDLSHLRLLVDDDGDFSNATVYSAADGITFSFGSIIVGGIGPAIIPAGAVKFVALGAADPLTPLPVELINFNVTKEGAYNKVYWQTASEINNDYFVVERSNDGIHWESITQIPGAGNSQFLIDYEYLDYNFCPEKCYYRLLQVDYDNTKTYSKVLEVSRFGTEKNLLLIFPNPTVLESTVKYVSSNSEMITLLIFNAEGREVYQAKVVCAEGENEFKIRTNHLASGVYFINIIDRQGNKKGVITFNKL